MISGVDLSNRLHHLSQELLGADDAQAAAGRCGNSIGERQRDRVVGVDSIYRSCIGCPGRVHHVIDRIQRKRNIIWNPEDSVSAPNDCLGCYAVGQSNARSQVRFSEWKVAASSRRQQKNISHHRRRTLRQILINVAWRSRVKIGKPIVALRPRTLQLITQSKIER